MFLIDTNILIYAMDGRYPKIAARLREIPLPFVKISAITIMELEYGATKSAWSDKTRARMRQFLSVFDVLPFTGADAKHAADIRAFLTREGQPIGDLDLLIAGQGRARDLTVITHNLREFQRVPGLKLEDWISDEF